MAYAGDDERTIIDVRQAFAAVKSFMRDLYGEHTASMLSLEELEYDEQVAEWLITVSINTPAMIVTGRAEREFKQFRVAGYTGKVLSMKIRTI